VIPSFRITHVSLSNFWVPIQSLYKLRIDTLNRKLLENQWQKV
jgi:hypothetical protein